MAYLVLEIEVPSKSIADLNSQCQKPTKPDEALQGCVNLLDGILGGAVDASVKVVSKDAATVIATSGSGSQSNTYNKL